MDATRPLLTAFSGILLSCIMLGSCICTSTGVNRGDINLVPIEEEWRMGEMLEQQLAQELPLLEAPEVLGYLGRLTRQLVDGTELADREWEVHLVADSAINAFTIPGGHVYVNTGLIAAADNVSELTGVMAHEIAHGIARHSTERLTTVYGLDVIASLILGDSPGILQQITTQIIGSGAVAKFSRDDEREADQLGLALMYEAGYNPEGMAAMFETLLANRQRRPGMVERFFSSHPLTEERIEAVRQAAGQLEQRSDWITDDAEFQQIRRGLQRPSW